MCPHPRMYPQTSIHAHIFARSISTHLCASAKTYTCIQNIHRHYTQRTYTHRYTHTLTHAHEYASALRISSALRIYRPIHMNIHLCTRIYVCAHIHEQQASTCTITDRHTNMHACTQSLTLTHTHSRVCACARVVVLCCKRVFVYTCV